LNQIENLIFDLDGTLIDSSDGVVAAVNYSLEQMGEPLQPPERIKPYIGYPLSTMYPDFTDKPLDKLYALFQVKAAETVISSTTALPGADETVRALHARGFRLAIATTKIKKHLVGIVEQQGWADLFSVLVAGDEVRTVKPDPEAINLTLSRLSCRNSDCYMIGDTENDILAAQAAGVATIGVKSPYGDGSRLRAAGPDRYVETISGVPALLADPA